jgi:predicted nuclease of predicted toxin-antitoxin system
MPSGASAAQREAERLASLSFFLDHQIGRYQVAEILRAAGAKVEVHLDHFPGDMPDVEWIPEVARRDWVLITKDQNIRRNPLERAAYRAARLRGFVVTGKDMNAKELGELLVRCLAGMTRRTAGRPGPMLFTISRGGTFTKLF